MSQVAAGIWQTSCLGCFKDCKMCMVTWCAPCYVAGKNAETVGQDPAWFAAAYMTPIAQFLCAAKVREQIRQRKGIEGSYLSDVFMHLCFSPCALQQEAMEMKSFTWEEATKLDRSAPASTGMTVERQ